MRETNKLCAPLPCTPACRRPVAVMPLSADGASRQPLVAGGNVIGLLAGRRRLPLVIARRRDDAIARRRDDAAALLKASRNISLPVIVSARALKVEGSSLSDFLHHCGTRPQRICQSSSWSLLRGISTSMVAVGAML